MLDTEDRRVLEQVRRAGEEEEPNWRAPWANYVLIVGGIALVVADAIATRSISGAAGAFMFGVGVCGLIIAVPMSRRIWRLNRLIRHADDSEAF
ncbi:MAG: hypothetical protein ACYTGN_12455 [Planctomycetota bacterium]|jgi:hypothetical protein